MAIKNSYIFLAPGVEEVEAIATIDALRRAHLPIITVSADSNLQIKGASDQIMIAETLIEHLDINDADWLIFPGGDPGARNLAANQFVRDKIISHHNKGGRFAAICAAPALVLGPAGILEGRKATCYPLMSELINQHGGVFIDQPVVSEPGLITSQAPGTALLFAIEIIRATKGDKMADGIARMMMIDR